MAQAQITLSFECLCMFSKGITLHLCKNLCILCLKIEKGLYSAGAILIESGINEALKYSVKRERPFVTYPDIQKISNAGSPSFPSGHTGAAFCTATELSLFYPKWYVVIPAFVWAAAVG